MNPAGEPWNAILIVVYHHEIVPLLVRKEKFIFINPRASFDAHWTQCSLPCGPFGDEVIHNPITKALNKTLFLHYQS